MDDKSFNPEPAATAGCAVGVASGLNKQATKSCHPVLVTGGAGFIGAHLVSALLRRGHTVRVLDLPGVSAKHVPLDQIELIRGDIRDPETVAGAVQGCRQVYHLAANPNLWCQKRGHFLQVNYRGAVNVLESAFAAALSASCTRAPKAY